MGVFKRNVIFIVISASILSFLTGLSIRKEKSIESPGIRPSVSQILNPSPTLRLFVQSTIVSVATETVSDLETVTISRVIDGDTIELSDGRRVRYIGIDTPETSDPRRSVECFGRQAYEKNRELVEGKSVGLEKDVSETDKFGRLLRYVYINNVLVNEFLVREGYAHSSSYPPDVKYQSLFVDAQRLARDEQKGLWGSACEAVSTTNTLGITGSGFTCDCNKACSRISSCEEAQFQLKNCGCTARDGDGDGTACDGAPLLCQH